MNESLRSLLPKEWADCVFHNLPISVKKLPEKNISIVGVKNSKVIRSLYELSKSTDDWSYSDFFKE